MAGSDPDRSGGAPDIYKLFCDYNAIYFGASLDACAVSWADDPLPDRDVSTCDYYPEGGGCVILLSKSLYECTNGSMKNVLLHEMIHAYICIKDGDNNHSNHGAKFQKVMNAINLSSIADPHRPVDGYSITTHHEIRKKYYDYKCESCGDLFKSSKMKGPSYDDCIEKIRADGLCQNLKCRWHRHKMWCSGSYHRVQESAPGSSELNCSEVDCSGLGSSSRDKSNKRIKLSKHVGIVQEVPKRPRTPVLPNQECSRRKKRKSSNWDGTYTVVIEWLNYYSVSDSGEDEAPLINKRTERRKRQKIIEMSLAREFSDIVKFASPTSHSVNGTNDVDVGSHSPEPRNNSKFAIVPAPRPEERLLPNHAVTNHEVAGDQAAHEYVSSPLDSPIRVDCSGLGSSSRDKSNKRIKLSKHVGIVQEVPKRPRTPVLPNQECSRRKKRKSSNWDGTYTVVIEWLNYYSVSDSGEDEAPLINKRTERRKRQKIIEMSLAREFSDIVKFASPTSHSVNGTNDVDVGSHSPEPRNNSKFAIVPAPRPEERLLPNHAVTNHEVAGDQAAHEYVSSPLDSPIRVDCSGLGSSSRDKSNKRIKLSKHVGIVQEVPKRPRTPVLPNQECSRRKKRKSSNWDGTYTVVIEWLNYYSVSDSGEDEAPLINKRTERRKRQKIIEMSLAREFSDIVKFASPTSHSVNGTNDVDVGSHSPEPRNNSKFAIVPAPRPEERLLPNHAVTNHEVAGDQAAHEYVSSPLDSPIRGDIIDISDG